LSSRNVQSKGTNQGTTFTEHQFAVSKVYVFLVGVITSQNESGVTSFLDVLQNVLQSLESFLLKFEAIHSHRK
jgi:hypothetical protein